MFSPVRPVIVGGVLLMASLYYPAHATTVDFETLTGPSFFSAVAAPGAQTLVLGAATFTGGVILTQAAFLPADQSSIYGTANFANSNLQYTNPVTNPLTVTFPSPITNFFLDVLNGNTVQVDYTVADNAGHSRTFNLAPNINSGATTIGFAATGNIITITSANVGNWDFFIDNVHFNEALPPNLASVPLPAALPLFATGLGALGLLGWCRKRKTAAAGVTTD
jgi:hypothetical protein